MGAGGRGKRSGRVPAFRPEGDRTRGGDRGRLSRPRAGSDSFGFSNERTGRTAASHLHGVGRYADSRPALPAEERSSEAPRDCFLPWRVATPDAAGLALHVLLLEYIRDESV